MCRAADLQEFLDGSRVKFFWLPIFSVALPTIILTYYSTEPVKRVVQESAPFIGEWLDFHVGYAYVYTVLAMLFQGVFVPGLSRLSEPVSAPSREKHLFLLKNVLEAVVKTKAARFKDVLHNLPSEVRGGELFEKITKPEQQIAIIVSQICTFFEQTVEDKANKRNKPDIKVRLLEVESGVITGYFASAPEKRPPRTDIAEFNQKDSTTYWVLTEKRSKFIPDIEREIRKSHRHYRPANKEQDPDQDSDTGSLYCFPISQEYNTIFILCVSCNKTGYLVPELKDMYEDVLEQFACRIRLEHRLIHLKAKTHEKQQT